MNRRLALGLLLAVAAVALALRVPDAGTRPLHNDEAVNATTLATLFTEGRYVYDPHEYHGPTLHYFSLPGLWLSGASSPAEFTDFRLRLVTIFFGTALVLATGLFMNGLGRPATLAAAALTAISPAMLFYSRYFIHEMLLVVFTALLLGASWRWWQTRKLAWAITAGVALGLMYATKETFLIPLIAIALSLLATRVWEKWLPIAADPARSEPRPRPWIRPVALALAVALAVGTAFFTSFFTNWRGLGDSVATYLPWLDRAGGASPHIHPWPFYFERLFWFHPARSPVWSEALIGLLALVGGGAALSGRGLPPCLDARLARWLTFYTLAMIAGYTLLSYKTPWCLLGFLQPMLLLAGLGMAVAAHVLAPRALVLRLLAGSLLVAASLQLTWQGWRLTHEFAADKRNPYAYSQTLPDVRDIVGRLEGLARVHPDGNAIPVMVVAPESYWPLPWYLRGLSNVGWYDQLPADPFAPVVLASTRVGAALDEKSNRKWLMAGMYPLRPGAYLELYVDLDLWKRYVATLPPETE
jgi:uncharacterized protein (TIGR03663 family)